MPSECTIVEIPKIAGENRLLTAALEATANAVVITNRLGEIEWVNPAFTELTGYAADEVLGKRIAILKSGRHSAEFYRNLWQTILSGNVWSGEIVNRRKDGRLYTERMTITPVHHGAAEITHFIAIKQDKTACIKTDQALRESERRYQALMETADDGIVSADHNGRIVAWNKGAERIFGYSKEEVFARPVDLLIPRHLRKRYRKRFEQFITGNSERRVGRALEVVGKGKDGTEVPLDISLASWESGEGRFYTAIVRDITYRKMVEEGLRDAHREIESLLASISSILIGVDGQHRITRWNKAAVETFGIQARKVLGRLFTRIPVTWNWEIIQTHLDRCRQGCAPVRIDEIRYTRPDGKERFLTLTINPVRTSGEQHEGFLLLGTDITEKKIIESQLSQAQKLEAIGQLAAGIAHEINTPIQYIGDNTRFLQDAFSDFQSLVEGCKQVPAEKLAEQFHRLCRERDVDYLLKEVPQAIFQTLEGVERVARIVRAMKEFSHPGFDEKKPTDINKALENTVVVARNEWKYYAELVTDFDPDLPPVPCLPGEINQVFLNLIVNAAHAVADVVGRDESHKGRITVKTRRKGDFVEIQISDTGTGIPKEVRQKVFDPFFTTKEVGKGTGQGLAIARSVVVDKHGGSITFETETGKGTTFVVLLPLNSNEMD